MSARVPERRTTAPAWIAAAPGGARSLLLSHLIAIGHRLRSENGQTLVEYSLILLLIALVCISALTVIGGTIQDFLQSMAEQV